MLFLPECFGFMGSHASETLSNAETIESSTMTFQSNHDEDLRLQCNDPVISELLVARVNQQVLDNSGEEISDNDLASHNCNNESISIMDGLRVIARAANLWISGGGIHEYIPDEQRVYNTHVILNHKGQLMCKYRKVHLFNVCLPDRGIDLQESKTTKPGNSLVVVCDSPIGMLGLTTCYDLRFAEQYTALVQQGAQILLIPSAFTIPTGEAHWHVLLRSRAIETQCYVLAAAQVGRHNPRRESYGHALAVNPWGEVMADAGDTSSPTIIICDIDLKYLDEVRLRMPIQAHRHEACQVTGIDPHMES